MTDIEKIKSAIRSVHSNPEILLIDNIVYPSDSRHDNDNLTEILKELMSFSETMKNVEGDVFARKTGGEKKMTFEEALKYWNIQLNCTEYMLEEHWEDNVSRDECNAHRDYIEAMKCAVIALEMYCESNQDGQHGRLTIADALHKLLIEGGDYDE